MIRTGGDIAIDILNSQQRILPGYYLTIDWVNDKCNADYSVQEFSRLWHDNQDYVGAAAAGCSGGCMSIATVAPHLRVPQFSMACASSTLSDTTRFPDFNRFMTPENALCDVINSIGLQYGWTRVVVITGDPVRFDGPSAYLENYFSDKEISAEWLVPRNPDWPKLVELMRRLKKEGQRVIVVFGYQPFYRRAVCAAFVVGFPTGIAWFSVGWHSPGWWAEDDPDLLALEPRCTPDVITEYYQGGIGAAGLGAPPESEMGEELDCLAGWSSRSFRDVLQQTYNVGYPVGENIVAEEHQTYVEVMGNGADGVCVFAYMLRYMIDQGYAMDQLKRPDSDTYRTMINYFKNIMAFRGVAGNIRIVGNDMPATLAISQYQDGEYKMVGTVGADGRTLSFLEGLQLNWAGDLSPGSEFSACPGAAVLQPDGSCKDCDPGRYFDAEEKECMACPAGRANPNSAGSGLDACSLCMRGSFGAMQGMEACNSCAPGRFSQLDGSTDCLDCDAGTHADEAGSFKCTVCPAGDHAEVAGMATCVACSPGSYAALPGSSACVLCKPGNIAVGESNTGCSPCSIGTYHGESGGIACSPCTKGHFAGSPGTTECAACAAGTFSNQTGRSDCEKCAVASYASSLGMSACVGCPTGDHTTMQRVMVKNEETLVLFEGAASVEACGCEPGLRPTGEGTCVECIEGMDCRGMADIWIEPGFAAEADLSVFKCHGNDVRCTGGRPGSTCAEGRTGVACGECEAGKIPNPDGTCSACEGGADVGVFILVCIIFIGALSGVYGFIDTKDHSKQNHALMLSAMSLSITVTIVQQLSIVSMMSLEWPTQMAAFFSFARLFTFDLEIIRFNCIASADPMSRFVAKVFVLAVGIVMMLLIHVVFAAIRYGMRLTKRIPSLIGSVGTLFTIFYISVVSTVLGPLQCVSNPNGLWTVMSYQSVVCWESSDHVAMVVVGMLALTVPLAFLAWCAVVTARFPAAMRSGKIDVLRAYAFLFFRYRVEVYWYSMVHMGRCLLLSLAPIIPNVVAQIAVMQAILLTHLVFTVQIKPWRVKVVNYLEVAITLLTLLVLSFVAFFVEEDDKSPLAWMAIILIIGMLLPVPVLVGYGLQQHLAHMKSKPTQFFLCHHKSGGGCFARLLKLQLARTTDPNQRKVLLDSDDMKDIDSLVDYVANMVNTLVVICSRSVLAQPWCLAEIVTAMGTRRSTLRILMPDYALTTEAVMKGIASQSNLQALSERGFSIEMVQKAVAWLADRPAITFTGSLSDRIVEAIAAEAVLPLERADRPLTVDVGCLEDSLPNEAQVAVLVDHSETEAVAAALILCRLLKPHLKDSPSRIPHVLPESSMPALTSNHLVLIVFTGPSLQHETFLKRFAKVAEMKPKYLAITVDEKLRFPTPAFLEENKIVVASITGDKPAFRKMVTGVFENSVLMFIADLADGKTLEEQAYLISCRIGRDSDLPMLQEVPTEFGEGNFVLRSFIL